MAVRKRTLAYGEFAGKLIIGTGVAFVATVSSPSEEGVSDAFHVRAHSEVTAGIHTPDSASITVAEATSLWLARCERDQLSSPPRS